MRKLLIIIFILFIFNNTFFSQDTAIEPEKIDSKYYGIKEKPETYYNDNYNKFVNFQNDMYTQISLLRKKSIKLQDLNKFFLEINDNTLKGSCVRDSILLYLTPDFNNDLINEFQKLINNNVSNKDQLKNIINKLKNKKLENIAPFSFSTMTQANKLEDNIILFMPNADWKKISSNNKSNGIYMGGGDYYTGTINIITKSINQNYNILKDENFNLKYIVAKTPEKKDKSDKFYYVNSSKIIKIAENIKIGDYIFNEIYERITVSSDKYDSQIFIERSRFYLTKEICYIIGISSVIVGINILADKDSLIKLQGFLLDTVQIMKK